MDKIVVFALFGLASLAFSVFAFVYSFFVYKKIDRADRVFSAFQLFTGGIFVSVFIVFLPVFYYDYDLFGEGSYVRPIFIAIHNTIRVFILDGDFDTVAEAIDTLAEWGRIPFSFYAALLYVVAPVLTFGNLLSLFKNLRGEIVLKFHKKRPMYIMSELNLCSISLAESIMNAWKAEKESYCKENNTKRLSKELRDKKPIIVFTDVFEQNEEADYELLLQARDLGAICLKKDISHLDLQKRLGEIKHGIEAEEAEQAAVQAVTDNDSDTKQKTRARKNEKKVQKKNKEYASGKIEIFLIGECETGENESENIGHAIKLTEKYKKYKYVSIFIYATSVGAGYLVDSIDKGAYILDDDFESKVIKDPKGMLYGDAWNSEDIQVDGGFYLRRVNCVEALVKNTLNDKAVFDNVHSAADKNDKTVSILIIGMGSYGKQFFKTALWFYQLDGYKLEINIFDADKYGEEKIKKQLEQECPELIKKNPCMEDGEANYDIRFFNGVDCFTSDFDKCFDSSEDGMRLKRTNLAFVTLGDDDKNIEAAVMLRKLFDRKLHHSESYVKKAGKDEMPIIYAVVYDDQKASNLGAQGAGLINHKRKQEYHIRFIGSRSSQYDYKNIENNRKIEHSAFTYHIEWLRNEQRLRNLYNSDPEFKATVDAHREDPEMPIVWADEYIFDYKGSDGRIYDDGTIKSSEIKNMASLYVNFEYYRRSSIAKALHKDITESYFASIPKGEKDYSCPQMEARRKTEHMRWNAYMRSEGYIVGVRNDRGKTHPNLCTYQELPYLERFKD